MYLLANFQLTIEILIYAAKRVFRGLQWWYIVRDDYDICLLMLLKCIAIYDSLTNLRYPPQ